MNHPSQRDCIASSVSSFESAITCLVVGRGFAALLAERLCLSVQPLQTLRLSRRGEASKTYGANGKPSLLKDWWQSHKPPAVPSALQEPSESSVSTRLHCEQRFIYRECDNRSSLCCGLAALLAERLCLSAQLLQILRLCRSRRSLKHLMAQNGKPKAFRKGWRQSRTNRCRCGVKHRIPATN